MSIVFRTGALALVCLMAGPNRASAERTRVWRQTSFTDFAAGTADGVSIRSDGRLVLAPQFTQIYETPSSYLWSLAVDSAGNLFAGGGPDARVFRLGADGRKSTFFETDAVEIHALAIDAQDNVYAATSPEAKIYKIDPSGGYEVFYDPGVEYIWALVFDSKGNLFAATGDDGQIHRITPDGQGSVFVETGEVHVRSLAIDAKGQLLAGTDPGGLVMRIDPSAPEESRTFVLYQAPKREITAVAAGPDGTVFAAGVGTRSSTVGAQSAATPAAPPASDPAKVAAEGSEVYRIDAAGRPSTIWESSSETVFSLAADEGGVLIGTGGQGRLLRAESGAEQTLVLTADPSQITAIVPRPGGGHYLATSNVGAVFQLGPGTVESGSFQSSTFDARLVSQWGRLAFDGAGDVSVEARTGNVLSTTRHWSDWSPGVRAAAGERLNLPNARFAQWKATLSKPDSSLDAVRFFFFRSNLPPEVKRIELLPPNRQFAPKPVPPIQTRVTNLPPLSATVVRRAAPKPAAAMAIIERPGSMGARWLATDPNGDTLRYRVEIRGQGESNWRVLKDDVENDYLDWDTTGLADGRYELRITASDAPSNPTARAATGQLVSEPFLVDNTGPALTNLSAQRQGQQLVVGFDAADSASRIAAAEGSVDGGDWTPILPAGDLFDAQALHFDWSQSDPGSGEHSIAVRVRDQRGNTASAKTILR